MSNSKDVVKAAPARELLNRKVCGSGPHPPRALDHLAFAILTDGGASPAESLTGLANLRKFFVDWNEARVARTQEFIRVLGDIPGADRSAIRIKEEYNAFFDKKGALSFEFLAAGKPAEMRRMLGQLLPHLARGAVSLLLFEFCVGATLPLSDEGMKQAKRDDIVGKSGDRGQLSRILGDSLEPAEIALLLQYWEIEATGHPYGEAGKKDAGKKAKKAPARGKTKAKD